MEATKGEWILACKKVLRDANAELKDGSGRDKAIRVNVDQHHDCSQTRRWMELIRHRE